MNKHTELKLTAIELNQLIHSLQNDWMDNDKQSCAIIERILKKLGAN